MKIISTVFASLLFSLNAFSQDSGSDKYVNKVLNVEHVSQDSLYKLCLQFIQKRPELLLYTNDKIRAGERIWSLKRAEAIDKDFKHPGTIEEYKSRSALSAHVIFCYKGTKNTPVEFLTVQGDVIIQCKDDKVRIGFANLSYTHKNLGAPPRYKDITGQGRPTCSNAGTYDELLNCKSSPATINNIKLFVEGSMNDYIEKLYLNIKGVSAKTTTENILSESW